jgi:acetyltransferase-like isoleucine patch superfamily enzyme
LSEGIPAKPENWASFAPLELAPTAIVGEHCTLGYPREARLSRSPALPDLQPPYPVIVGDRCLLFNQVIVYEGVRIGEDCVVEDRVRIGYNSRIGPRSRLVYGAYICDRVTVGSDARVAGFVCDGTNIGDRSTVMGRLVHEYSRPHQDWWEVNEEAPVIEADSVVGYGAMVVGAVRIGPRSYVGAGAVVTKDVPPYHVAIGVNEFTPAEQWRGGRLTALIEHWTSLRSAGQAGTPPPTAR